jgi:hypothetical protein
MKIYRVFFPFILACLAVVGAAAQEDYTRVFASIDHYALKISVDEGHHLLHGEAHVRLHTVQDSVSQIHFIFDSSMVLLSVRDSLNKKLEIREQIFPAGNRRREISVLVADTLKRGDRIFLNIAYEALCDTAPTLSSFINEREILLAPDDSAMWWPILSPSTNPLSNQVAPTILEATLSSGFNLVPMGEMDSAHVVGSKTVWTLVYDQPKRLSAGFLLCASRDFVKSSIATADSSVQLSLYSSPGRFDKELAAAVLQQLGDAYSFFTSLTGARQSHSKISVAIIGTDDGSAEWFSHDGVLVGRNSYAYSLFNSTLLSSSQKNEWVHGLAHVFGIAATDSTFWFDEGWANYLTMKFFLRTGAKEEEAQREARLDLFSTTLDFYPSQTLAQGRKSGKNEEAVFFKRGACIFLMLEYILGEDAFSGVTRKLYEGFTTRPITIFGFQRLCEETYGSPLDWFFREWVFQTGFPELILSTDVTQTNRGNYLLKATIGQRGNVFRTPADLVFSSSSRSLTKRVFIERRDQEFEFILPFLPTKSELDPNYYVLRWVPRLRLLAHARTAVNFRVFDRDLANSEREALLTLQLDPNNLTGWNNIALFALGKSAVIKGEITKAEEYFRRASALEANEPTQLYSVLSLVRLGNVLEIEEKRDEALEMYKLSETLAERNPALYSVALFEARKYLREKFVSSDEFWFGEY